MAGGNFVNRWRLVASDSLQSEPLERSAEPVADDAIGFSVERLAGNR
jgi:hypothetical protein